MFSVHRQRGYSWIQHWGTSTWKRFCECPHIWFPAVSMSNLNQTDEIPGLKFWIVSFLCSFKNGYSDSVKWQTINGSRNHNTNHDYLMFTKQSSERKPLVLKFILESRSISFRSILCLTKLLCNYRWHYLVSLSNMIIFNESWLLDLYQLTCVTFLLAYFSVVAELTRRLSNC